MLIFDNGIIKAYARIFPENRKRTRLEIEQTARHCSLTPPSPQPYQ